MTDQTENGTGLGTTVHEIRDLIDEQGKATLLKIDDAIDRPRAVLRPDGSFYILNPNDLDAYRQFPLFRSGRPQLTDLDSLISFTNRHKDIGSVIFANDDRAAPAFDVAFDYHHAGDGDPRFGRFSAGYAVPLSDEWTAWQDNNGESMTLPEFARFLDDHIVDVMPPEQVQFPDDETKRFISLLGGAAKIAGPAKLVELTQGVAVFEESDVTQATNLQSGEMQLSLSNRHTGGDGQPVKIPSMVVLGIPVFKSGEVYQVLARLRYRKAAGGIVFFYELWRDDRVFDHAFDEACDRLAGATDLPLFRGRRS